MKLLTLTVLFVITTLTFAQDNDYKIHIKEIWAEQGKTPGKQYFALLDEDVFHTQQQIMIFGKKNQKMRSRFFSVGWSSLPIKEGTTRYFQDDFYQISITKVDAETLSFKMTGVKPGFTYHLVYKKLNEKQFKKIQSKAWAPLMKEYKRLTKVVKIHTPKTIKQLKDIARLLNESHDFWSDDNEFFTSQFEDTLDEIDSIIKIQPENSQIAKAQIKPDATDLISKTFVEDGQWTREDLLPEPGNYYLNEGDQAWKKTFSTYYHQLPKGNLKEGSFKRGLEKFLKVAILKRSFWECEGDFAWKTDYIWILKDGSEIKYSSDFECD